MADTIFDLEKFILGSGELDRMKKSINLALAHFYGYFRQVYEAVMSEKDPGVESCIIVNLRIQYHKTIDFVAKNQTYNIIVGDKVISTGTHALAEHLSPEITLQCYLRFGDFMEKMFQIYPPHQELLDRLETFYAAAERAKKQS